MLRFSTTTRLTALLVSGLSLGLFLFACSSTTVGTGPGDTGDDDDTADSGGDAGHVTVHDAGTDGSVVTDGGGSGQDGGPVLGTDGGSDGGSCDPVEPPTSYTYHAPVDAGGACTDVAIADYVQSCGQGSKDSDCVQFHNSASPACLACLETDVTQVSQWGAVLTDSFSHIITVNSAGCIATLDPASLSCAESIEDALQCENAACDVPCDSTDYATQSSCEDTADDLYCEDFVADVNNCIPDLPSGDSQCLGTDFNTLVGNVAGVLCGGGGR